MTYTNVGGTAPQAQPKGPMFVPPSWQVDPNRQEPLGVLCGDVLYVYANHDPRIGPMHEPERYDAAEIAGTIQGLGRAGLELGLSAIWMVPVSGASPAKLDPPVVRDWGARPWAKLPKDGDFLWGEITARGRGGASELGGIRVQGRNATGAGKGKLLRIHASWVQDAWRMRSAFAQMESYTPEERAKQVALGIWLATYLLGAQIRFTQSHTGLTMMRGEFRRFQDRGLDLTLPAEWKKFFDEHRAVPIQWATNGPAGGAGDLPIHKYDRNGSYVASAREVGVGAPLHFTGDARYPGTLGIFEITATPPAWFDQALTPGPFWVNGEWMGEAERVWCWSPQIRLALAHGWEVTVHQGWYWPKTQVHDIFRSWQDRIWEARLTSAKGKSVGAVIASGIIKQTGVAAIGRLVPQKGREIVTLQEAKRRDLPILWHDEDERGRPTGMVEVEVEPGRADLIRPDWWSIIISNAVERLLNACYVNARDSAVCLYVDALYAPHEIPALAGDRNARGKFKLEASRQIPREIAYSGNPIAVARAFAGGEEVFGG